MKLEKYAGVLLAAVLSAPLFAVATERLPGGVARPAPTAQPTPPPVERTQAPGAPMQLAPAHVKKLSKPEPPSVGLEKVNVAMSGVMQAEHGYSGMLQYMQAKAKACSTKAYSVQDQQAAGCAGSNTVEQCAEKLYEYCMSKNFPSKDEFRVKAEKVLAAARTLAQQAQAHANHVQYMLNTYGK